MPVQKNSKPTIVSLFAGCGGLDLGFKSAGFDVLAAYDADREAISTYKANHGPLGEQRVLGEGHLPDLKPDVIVAGPPCQGFSTGGGYNANDPRNSLLLSTCKMIAAQSPKLAVIENVAALTNKRNQGFLRSAISTLQDAGYFCEIEILHAAEFGVAQRRRRTVITARRSQTPFRKLGFIPAREVTVGEALFGLAVGTNNHLPEFPKACSQHRLIARHIKPDQKLCNVRAGPRSVPTWDIPECFGSTSSAEREILTAIRTLRRRNRKRTFGDADPVTLGELSASGVHTCEDQVISLVSRGYLRKTEDGIDLKNTFNGKYRRLDENGHSPTVDTRFGDIQLFLHPTEDRSMTVREAARIQGFPDDFVFPESKKSSFRLIGNAVPPPMAKEIALRCRELI